MTKCIWILISLFILYGVLIPFQLTVTTEAIFSNIASISWIPFVDPDGTRASIPDIVQNILLFFPFGFVGFLSLTQARTVRRIALVTGIGALFSGSIELLQLFTTDRTTSLTDLSTNTIGSFCGALAASVALFIASEVRVLPSFRKYRHNTFLFPLLVSCALVAFGMLQPFDFTLDVGSVWPKIRYLFRNPFEFTLLLRDEGVVFLRFVLLSYVGIRFLRENEHGQSFIKGILMSMAIGVCLEGSQLIVASRMPGAQDILVVLVGSLGGGLLLILCDTGKIPRRLWFILLVGATFFSVGIQLLSPFRLAEEYRRMNLIPFLPYYERTTFVALSNAIESLLMFFPLGFWGYDLLSHKIPRGPLLAIVALGIALPLEFAQGWILYRYPDTTDVLGALAGTLAGLWICSEGWTVFARCVKKVDNPA